MFYSREQTNRNQCQFANYLAYFPSNMTAWPSTNMSIELKIGDPAPDFKATAVGGIYGGGQEVQFADFTDSTLVLYFYPEDDTPGCTKQACDLRDSWRELQSKVELFGVSTDSIESHQEFIKKHGLPFPLLSDSDQEIVKAYQVWAEKSIDGEKRMGRAFQTGG
jgi:peroxiredoxin Q/BCP